MIHRSYNSRGCTGHGHQCHGYANCMSNSRVCSFGNFCDHRLSKHIEGLPESSGGTFKTKILLPMSEVTKDDVLDALPPAFEGMEYHACFLYKMLHFHACISWSRPYFSFAIIFHTMNS